MCWKLSTGIEYRHIDVRMLSTFYRYVEVLDKYFGSVCELDIIFNFEKAYFILDELILGGEMQVGEYGLSNTEYGIWNTTEYIQEKPYKMIYSLVPGFCQHQETSKKAVLSQIEQADKFQEVKRRAYLCERRDANMIVFQEEIVELALKDIGLI